MAEARAMNDRVLSLAAGVLPEFPPDAIVRAAAHAGYPAAGIWCDTQTWTDATTQAVARELRDGALLPLDIEVIWIRPGRAIEDAARRLIDIGGVLGARHVLIVSANPSIDDTKHQFAALCERAASAGMRAMLEFLMIAQVQTLAQAVEIVTDVGPPAGGVLVDALHLARCGATPNDVARLAPHLLPYAQLCDGPARLPNADAAAYLTDAVDGRSAPGEGELPLRELLAVLPAQTPLSLEVRSKRYRDAYPDPVDRARAVLDATRRFIGRL
jgi:sugar phosphate isomerase/epimerase